MEEQYGKSKILFDTFVCDPIPVNRFIYRSWLEGLTEKETAARRDSLERSLISPYNNISSSSLSSLISPNNTFINSSNNTLPITLPSTATTTSTTNTAASSGINISTNNVSNISSLNLNTTNTNIQTSTAATTTIATWQQLLEEIEDQFRNFSLLRNVLEHPKTLSPHSMFQVDPTSRRLLIEGYYDFDDTFIRELIGRKLTSGQRRDLDDTSEKLKIRLSTCERQFDNLKRISRLVFTNIKLSPIDLIMSEFCLSRELSKKYIKILFLCFHRIDISHKRIQPLNTLDLMKLAEIVMNNWGDPLRSYSMELEIKLKEDVRDLKVNLLSKEVPERYLKIIKSKYQNNPSSTSSYSSHQSSVVNSNNNSNNNSVGQSPKINSSLTIPSPILMNQQPTTTTTSSNTTIAQPTPPLQSNNTSLNNSNNYVNTPSSSSSVIPPLPTSAFSLAQYVPSIVTGDKLKSLESKFKSILKGILAIGSNLSDSKEFRNLFEDIIDKIVDPLKRIDMTINEADTFFVFLRESFTPENLGLTLRHKDRLVHNWKSFLEGMRAIVVYLYDK